MKQCAFLTMEDSTGFFTYDHLAVEPLATMGWQVQEIPWNRQGVDWDTHDAVVIRSPWDYQDHPEEFMRVLERIEASSAQLENPLNIVRWNVDKTYLQDLRDRGVAIVPTQWRSGLDREQLAELGRQFAVDEIIVKPVIGANADDTFRLTVGDNSEQENAAIAKFQDRRFMAQPFIHAIAQEGEYSLFYFGGEYSHAIRKVPKAGDFRVQEEHGGSIERTTAGSDLLKAGQKAIDAVGQKLLYARVDLVRADAAEPLLMELELIEPSLYFPFDDDAPLQFARALDQMTAGH